MGMSHNAGASAVRVVFPESPLLRPVSHYKNMKGKDNRRRTKRSARLLRNWFAHSTTSLLYADRVAAISRDALSRSH